MKSSPSSSSKSGSVRTGEAQAQKWTEHEHTAPAIENEARRLVEHAGSPEAARQAVDAAADQVSQVPASDKDAFARRHGFTSYLDLFEASSVVRSVGGKNWCVTAVADQKWLLWNERDLKAESFHNSLEEAKRAIPEQ